MSISAIIAWTILGGLWRRAMGGWLAISRGAIVWCGILTLSIPVGLAVGAATYWPYGLLAYVLHGGLSFAFFVSGLHLVDWAYDWLNARWDEKWQIGGFVDGPRSVVELVSGAVWYLPAAFCWLWVL